MLSFNIPSWTLGASLTACLMSVSCASTPQTYDSSQGRLMTGQFMAELDPNLSSYDMVPGTRSRFAQVRVCQVDDEAGFLESQCEWYGTDGKGVLKAHWPHPGAIELKEVNFSLETRDRVARASPLLDLSFDSTQTIYRSGTVEQLSISIRANNPIPSGEGAVELGHWRLLLLPSSGRSSLECEPDQAQWDGVFPLPPSDWLKPQLCWQGGAWKPRGASSPKSQSNQSAGE